MWRETGREQNDEMNIINQVDNDPLYSRESFFVMLGSLLLYSVYWKNLFRKGVNITFLVLFYG